MPKKVVILGAGFGGLKVAMKLGRAVKRGRLKDHEVVLIDKNDYHTYTPTLYEAATTSKDTADFIDLKSIVTFPIEQIIKGLPIKFFEDEVQELDLSAREMSLHLKSGYNIKYDYLVVALGSVTNDFGIPGLKDSSRPFKSFTDSLIIRDVIWDEMHRENPKDFNVVIAGGGSTGVELAGELRLWLNQLERHSKRKGTVTICEGTPKILPGFKENIIQKVETRLSQIGVKIVAGKMIKSVVPATAPETGNEIDLGDEKLKADLLVWAGGVKPNPILEGMPLRTMKGRAEVEMSMVCIPSNPDLSFAGSVFGVGDIVCINDPKTSRPVPMVARAALLEANIVAKNIIKSAKGEKHVEFKPMEYPYIIPVGGKYAVARIGKFVFAGFWAWIFKLLVELNYLISIMPVWRAVLAWLKGIRIFIQNERLG